MKHPTVESLQPLLNAVDTACWCLAVKAHTKKGQRCKVDWKSSLTDLQEIWGMYQLTHSDLEAVIPETQPPPERDAE